MRDGPVHAFKAAAGGNGAQALLGANVSIAVTVPQPGNAEYPGVLRIVNAGVGLAFVRTSNLAVSPAPATSADIPCPPNVVCYIELDQDTKFLSVFGAGTGSLFVNVGTGGLSS